jgi:hypothetical protein
MTDAPQIVSFMITQAQKEHLRQLGYDDAAISEMTPGDAHRILHEAGGADPNVGKSTPETQKGHAQVRAGLCEVWI